MKLIGSFLFVFLILSESQLIGQISNDSLVTLSSYEIVDNQSLNDFKKVFNRLAHSNPQQAKELIPVFERALEKGDWRVHFVYYKHVGWYYHMINAKDSAELFLHNALEIALKENDPNYTSIIYADLGTVAMFHSNYPKALTYYQRVIGATDTLNQRNSYAEHLSKMGHLYRRLKQYDEALKYLEKALKIKKEIDVDDGQASILNEIANVHYHLGDFEKVIKMDLELAEFNRRVGDIRSLSFNLNNLGEDYIVLEQYDKAISYLKESIALKKKVGNESYLISGYLNMVEALSANARFEEASRYLDSAYSIVKKGSLEDKSNYYRYAYEMERSKGDFEGALEMFEKHIIYRDSIFSRDNVNTITELETKFETENKEKEILLQQAEIEQKKSDLARQSTWRNALIIVILLIAGFTFVIYRKNGLIKKQHEEVVSNSQLISDQKKKLEELDEFKSQFFANVSHDLRTPISLIHGYLHELKDDEESYFSAQARLVVDKGLKNVDRLIHLTEEIRDLILMEKGTIELSLKRVQLKSYMTLLTGLFRSRVESQGLDFVVAIEIAEDFEIGVDPDQFEKIVYNLLSNAIKFTEEGEVKVTVFSDGRGAVLAFSDTGRGMSQAQQDKVFDRFYQAPNDNYLLQQGMGIGLFLVKELVTLHGGIIEVESTEGRGSKFVVRLPANLKPEMEKYDPVDSEYIEGRTNTTDINTNSIPIQEIHGDRATILVTDDHPEVRTYIGNQLKENYDVLFAANGIEALEILEKMSVDLLITDLMMPLMDGFELMKNVNEKFNTTPVMVVSARTAVQDMTEILGYGINDFVSKPFDKKDFLLRVANLIKSTRKSDFPVFEKDHLKLANNNALDQLNALIRERLSDSRLGIPDISDVLCLSERQTNRVVKSITGKTPGGYIKEYRLTHAEKLLQSRQVSSSTELARMIGYNNVSNFKSAFKKRFGYPPEDLID
ncbi:MAG: tetratricopeptide repeat protein [Cyclobacteriaceae bacterium]